MKVNRPSSIDRLPEEIRASIGKLRRDGRTIDEILDHLKQLDVEVSRSALGRHVKTMAEIGEEIRRTETMARFIVDKFGDESDERVGRANMRLLQSALMGILAEARVDEDGQRISLSAEEAKSLSLSLQRLVSAQRTDAERELKMRSEFAREAARKLDAGARSGEIDPEAVARAKRILGFD